MAYTLQSTINGKYISSLFSDSHKETFKAKDIADAYKWYNRSTVEDIQKAEPRIQDCKIVEVEYNPVLL
jgi:hypothetical protein